MKVGIIDLGSNTFNLLIAEIGSKGEYKQLYRSKVGVKLGEGSFEKNYITEAAMQRGMIALEAQIAAIKNQYCDRILAFATSAIRNASNGDQFVKRVFDTFGVKIKVIDGNEEAHMIFQGVQLSDALGPENALIMDIGGGSTEFILANEDEIIWKQSFELGVTRLREMFTISDPIAEKEIELIEAHFDEQLAELNELLDTEHVKTLVGCSGSFDTFNDVLNARKGIDPDESLSTVEFKFDELVLHLQELIRSRRTERSSMAGMPDLRIDMIPIAALLTNYIIKRHAFNHAKLSRYALKEGVLFDVLKGNI